MRPASKSFSPLTLTSAMETSCKAVPVFKNFTHTHTHTPAQIRNSHLYKANQPGVHRIYVSIGLQCNHIVVWFHVYLAAARFSERTNIPPVCKRRPLLEVILSQYPCRDEGQQQAPYPANGTEVKEGTRSGNLARKGQKHQGKQMVAKEGRGREGQQKGQNSKGQEDGGNRESGRESGRAE